MNSITWTLWSWLRPSIDALFARNITFAQRWRMLLLLQPITFITYSIAGLPWLFSRAFTTEYITLDTGRTCRILVFKSKEKPNNNNYGKLRPLHLDMHGGGFIGGLPEFDACFCDLLARTTGAVVISTTYRYAPPHTFPAAIDDVDAVVRFLHTQARERWGAKPELMTVSGFSAGGNLAIASTQQPVCHAPFPTAYKAAVTYHGVMNLRLKPAEKPRPRNAAGEDRMPKNDPVAVLLPLMDAYAERARKDHMEDPRMNPMLAELETLPKDVLLIVPAVDILVHEQLTFAERIKGEIEADPNGKGNGRSFEAVVYEKGFHGWTECECFAGVLFIREY
jgi:acetyl esterase/lipase